jgi:hypothetical protein
MSRWGNIPKLIHANYDEWKVKMILSSSAMKPFPMVTGDDPEPQPEDFNHNVNYEDSNAEDTEAISIIRIAYSLAVWRIINSIRYPHDMWNTLETSLDTARFHISRQDILLQISAC